MSGLCLILLFFPDAPVACSIANSKTSNALEKDLDLLASVPSPSSVSRKVSLLYVSELKRIPEKLRVNYRIRSASLVGLNFCFS